MVARHVLVVLSPGAVPVAVIELDGQPDGFLDLARAAVSNVTPAGPALVADDVVLHRVRAPLDHSGPPPRGADQGQSLGELIRQAVEEESGQRPVPEARAAWCRRGWAEQAMAWTDAALATEGAVRIGAPVVAKSWSLSHVTRLSTNRGDRFGKATPPLFAAEPALTRWLGERFPGAVPDVVAADAERGFLLMRPLPESRAVDREWALARTAASISGMQVACGEHVSELAACGLPPRTLSHTMSTYAEVTADGIELQLLDATTRRALVAAGPWVGEQASALAACGLPDTLCHGDLHLGNVAFDDGGGAVLFDWSDAHIGHPFLDVAHLPTVDTGAAADSGPGRARWADAYLEPWRQGYDDVVLRRALDLAATVDLAFQAVTYERIQRSVEPAARRVLHGVQAGLLRRITGRAGSG